MLTSDKLREIPLPLIDHHNTVYRISKDIVTKQLLQSIRNVGILSPPTLLKNEAGFTILTGHNRIRALGMLGAVSVKAYISESFTPEVFLEYGLLKNYNNELGPIGKLVVLHHTRGWLSDRYRLEHIARNEFHVPIEVFANPETFSDILGIDEHLKKYLDQKEIPYKTILQYLMLPGECKTFVSSLILKSNLKMSSFKETIELLYDLKKRNGPASLLNLIDEAQPDENESYENKILDKLRALRFPEYSKLKDFSRSCVNEMQKSGFHVKLPEYFEGDRLEISFSVTKRQGISVMKEKLNNLNYDTIEKLLSIL